jgi:uncharacterized protein YprB with RNaseH-like and TPR domain
VTLLSDRLRGLLKPPAAAAAPGPGRLCVEHGQPVSAADSLQDVLGGEWRQDRGSRCFVVERRIEADARCGRVRVGDLAAWHERAAPHAPMLTGGAPARPPFVFFDLETTGLSGGAGTYAFLVGCGRFADEGAFLTQQYVLAAFGDERAMLEMVARELARAGALVTFNGRSFDAPLLETRYLYHRLDWTVARLPHIDVLHSARRFWGATPREMGNDGGSCSLVALEQQVLGMRRLGDVPGFEMPGRYFQFVRSGDARPLAAVLEHNRLDLLSLAGLTARLMRLVAEGPDEAADAREALALGRVYGRSGLEARACEAFERVLSMSASVAYTSAPMAYTSASMALIKTDALRALACAARRACRYEDAAALWRQVLDVTGCPQRHAREATAALAIHHEHRSRDLAAAKAFAQLSLDTGMRPAWNNAVRHRLARIERKMTAGGETSYLYRD